MELTSDHWYLRYTPTGESPMSGDMYWDRWYAAETDLGTQTGGHDGSAAHGGGAGAWDWDCGWGVEIIPLQLAGFTANFEDMGSGNFRVTLKPAGPTIRDNPSYVASTGLTLGPIGSEWGGSTGFTLTNPLQINLEYQAGIYNVSIEAFNGYDPYGTWAYNFSDSDQYVLKIGLAGNLPIYTYPDIETPGGANIQWTLTGWHQTLLAGDIVSDGSTTTLRVIPSGTYRPFPNDPPVNDVEVFDGNIDTEVLGYTFAGDVEDIIAGSILGVTMRTGSGLSEVWVDDDYCETCENDGHFWNYDAFDSIQDGIDAVTGSTIHVAAGTYTEQVVIDKSVNIIGAGSAATFIQPGAFPVIDVTANDVSISDLAITDPAEVAEGIQVNSTANLTLSRVHFRISVPALVPMYTV